MCGKPVFWGFSFICDVWRLEFGMESLSNSSNTNQKPKGKTVHNAFMDFFWKMDNSWVYKMHKNNWTIHSFETINHPKIWKTWNLEAHLFQHSWFAGFWDLMRSFLRRAPSQKISVRNGFSRCFSYRISTNSPTAMLFRVQKINERPWICQRQL